MPLLTSVEGTEQLSNIILSTIYWPKTRLIMLCKVIHGGKLHVLLF